MTGIEKNSSRGRIPKEMPKSPVRDEYGLPYSQLVIAERVLKAKRMDADLIIAEGLLLKGQSTDSLVYNELSELASEGEDSDAFGVAADLVADQWMVDFLKKNPQYRDRWYIEDRPSILSQIKKECRFIKAVLAKYGDTVDSLISRFDARMWDVVVFKGNSHLVIYKGFIDESAPMDDLNIQEMEVAYAIWLDRPYKQGYIGDADQTMTVSGTEVA